MYISARSKANWKPVAEGQLCFLFAKGRVEMGWIIVASWLLLAIVFVLFGKLCDSKVFIGIGAIMLLMTSMVGDVTY